MTIITDVEDEYSLQYFLSAHVSTKEDTNENSKMKIPRSPEERKQIGIYCVMLKSHGH